MESAMKPFIRESLADGRVTLLTVPPNRVFRSGKKCLFFPHKISILVTKIQNGYEVEVWDLPRDAPHVLARGKTALKALKNFLRKKDGLVCLGKKPTDEKELFKRYGKNAGSSVCL
tara:strand:- start:16444 stop:16791 length:348 start_codon:yes stop_codon:yes gene_type:complete